jgi:hypothetical protein
LEPFYGRKERKYKKVKKKSKTSTFSVMESLELGATENNADLEHCGHWTSRVPNDTMKKMQKYNWRSR